MDGFVLIRLQKSLDSWLDQCEDSMNSFWWGEVLNTPTPVEPIRAEGMTLLRLRPGGSLLVTVHLTGALPF